MSENELWLTQVRMNIRNREARRDLRDVVDLHRTVMSMFPDVSSNEARQSMGVLYRLDVVNERPVLLVQAPVRPDPKKLPDGYGDVALTSLISLINQFQDGLTIRYRIMANATKRPNSGQLKGKRIALGVEDAKKWWAERASEAGIMLIDEPTFVAEILTGTSLNKSQLTLRPWRVDGIAAIVDINRLTNTLKTGIGRGKAYGCGMLSVAIPKAR